MPRSAPPKECPGQPVLEPLKAGTVIFRVHLAKLKSGTLKGNTFNPTPAASASKGGRFDHTVPGEAFLYAGKTLEAAVAETLLRDLRVTPAPRRIPFKQVRGRMISRLRVERALEMVSLHGKGLSQLGQDLWLTSCDPPDYPITRAWATAIRSWAPTAAGFVWRSRRQNDELVYVFYESNVAETDFIVLDTCHADADRGLAQIRRILASHLAVLPQRRR